MGKIYRRKTQVSDGITKKKDDEHARKRNVIVNFRVSPEEKELIDARISMSGLSRSDFFIESCLYQAILVKGNIKTYDRIKARMEEIAKGVQKCPELEGMDSEMVESWKTILEILEGRYRNERK